jgi:uncharacterized Ntn-hydrolase superfamily protein
MISARSGTYSIVARDADTGALGVAVQSHWFSVGSVVSWGRAGVGAVATQSVAEPAYGPRLLDRLQEGEALDAALEALLAEDEAAHFRQVAAVDAAGAIAVHTGEGCIEYAGHATGEAFSAQANMMASPEVSPAMAEAFSSADGPLARRLLVALEAAERAGGDVRGRQSTALLVVPAEGEGWQREVELRVEDHPEPLVELSRLLDLHDAYALASEGDELVGEGRHEESAERYKRASQLAPDNDELLFWAGLSLAQGGDVEQGAAAVRRAIDANQGWRELLLRLDEDIAPSAETVRRALQIGD